MITPQQWIHAMEQPPATARAFVASQARLLLTAFPPTRDMGTMALTDRLWPTAHATGTAIELRKKMVNILLKCAVGELADCAKQGEPKARGFMGKTARPWLWSTPSSLPVPSANEVRQQIIEAIKYAPAGQMMSMKQAGEIADVILARAKVTFT